MKRWIHAATDDAGLQSAKRMMADRMDYLRQREDSTYQQLEQMPDDEEDYENSDQAGIDSIDNLLYECNVGEYNP